MLTCAIRTDFHHLVKYGTQEIIITLKMGFGTVTAILSIMAKKLGSRYFEEIDIDGWSVCNVEENFNNNDCSKIKIKKTSGIYRIKFDIIHAKINRNKIIHYQE